MSSVFDKLNLRPQERRLIVIVGVAVFVVLNFVFVFPNFGAFGIYQQRTADITKKRNDYNTEISRQSYYQKEITALQKQGTGVATEEQALTLATDVSSQAILSGVTISSMTPASRGFGGGGGKTNAFFEEQTVVLNVTCGEKELVDFLYRLADKDLLIRAKSMQISPDIQTRMRLQGPITLVKSFQRKQPARSAVTAAAFAPTAPKPAASNTPAPVATPKATNVTPPKATNISAQVPRTIPSAIKPATNPSVRTPIPPIGPGGTNRLQRRPPTPVIPPPK